MKFHALVLSILYIGLIVSPLSQLYGQELASEPLPEEVVAPEPEPPATTTPELSISSEEEPELVWGCAMEYVNGSDVETERCGMGYYRTLCFDGGAGEECTTFFEFYEEPEEPVDPMTDTIERLKEKEYLLLSASINDHPLADLSSHAMSVSASSTLTWSYAVNPPEEFYIPHYPNTSFEEAFNESTLTLQIYRGAVGESTLVYEAPVDHGAFPNLTLPALPSDTYIFVVAGTYPGFTGPPGFECEIYLEGMCHTVPRWNIDSFQWVMEHGRAFYDEQEDESDAEYQYRDESNERRNRLREYIPIAFGMLEVEIGTPEPETGPSSVLFLPGIKGSRLYKPSDTCDPFVTLSCPSVKLWEPSGNALLQDLYLNLDGTSHRSDIYVKEGDIMAEALGQNFYASFVNQMDALVADGTLPAWKAVAYDWRLSLDDLVNNGVKRGDKIYFKEETETPYIEETLRELAAASPTGKVSIISHSNGGLVTKRLMQKLEEEGEASLVDKIIFVGVPQSGAPQAMAGLLYGYGEALPFDACAEHALIGSLCSLLGSRATAREFAEHSPMAYHLLPSQRYFSQVQDAEHPLAKFSGTRAYAEERASYGPEIASLDEMQRFLRAEDGGRVKPATEDTKNANVLSSELLSYGRTVHEQIDSWVPPSNIKVYQIAGWGVDTVAGVDFYEQETLLGGYKEMYRPIFVEDGDGVVPVPSALQMEQGLENVEEFWVDLEDSNFGPAPDRNHGDVLELDEVRVHLRNILLSNYLDLSEYISKVQPAPADREKLIFFLHSPLTLEIRDSEGRHAGENINGGFDQDIPDVTYGEFGDVKYIIAPKDEYELILRGKASGTFSLDIQNVRADEVVSTMTVADVPTTEDTVAVLQVLEDEITPLEVDVDGNGVADISIAFNSNETVIYQPASASDSIEPPSEKSSRNESTEANEISQEENNVVVPRFEVPGEATPENVLAGEVLGAEDTLLMLAPSPESDRTTYSETETNFFSKLVQLLYTWWEWFATSIHKIFN